MRGAHRLVYGLGQHGKAFEQCFEWSSERRGDFDGLAPGAYWREEEKTFLETAFDHGMSKIMVGLFAIGLDHLNSAHEAAGRDVADHIWMRALNFLEPLQQHRPKFGRVAGKIRFQDLLDIR